MTRQDKGRGVILAFGFEDFIILPLILVLSLLSLQICYRKLRKAYFRQRNVNQCPNKYCIRCRKMFTKDRLAAKLANFKLKVKARSGENSRLTDKSGSQNSCVHAQSVQNQEASSSGCPSLKRIEDSIQKMYCSEKDSKNKQCPTVIYFHDLEPIEPFHPTNLTNLADLKKNKQNMASIIEELDCVLSLPNLWVKNKTPSGSWKLFYFFNQGKMQSQNCAICPKTTDIILNTSSFMKNCSFGNAAFSYLSPGSKIPKHAGATNARLRCHVTLKAGWECSVTVGNETEIYTDGKILLFDDSFPHFVEFSGGEGGARVILMVDVWHPGLSSIEREAIEDLFSI